MNFIVLIKQVPDVSNIPEEAWDREKGTLRRNMLDNVLNPLDFHAITFACQLREKFGDESGKVICLTMGPPMAKEVLLDGIARGADEAILLTDRAFSGADTIATAYSLAQCIRKVEREIFNGNREYIIITGMQSVDGDTAQVPPQVAEVLGMEQIAYAQSFDFDKRLVVKRIGPHGMESIVPKRYPVLITTTACTEPLYRSFHGMRGAREKTFHQWSAADIQVDQDKIGLKGSRTQVYRIFSPSEERKKECCFPKSVDELIDLIEQKYKQGPVAVQGKVGQVYAIGDKKPSYHGELWVYIEQWKGHVAPVSYELLAKARELAVPLKEKVGAVLVGHQISGIAKEMIARGADKVYVVDDPQLEYFLPMPYKKAVSSLVIQHKPQIMLFGATPLGRELAPRVASSSNAGLTADCTKLEIEDFIKGKVEMIAILKQTRPALGGNIMATIMTKDCDTQMATVRPGVLKANEPDPARTGEIIPFNIQITADDIRTEVIARESLVEKASLAHADIIISGGRGLGTKSSYDKFIRPLAAAFGEMFPGKVEIGASRMAVEDGFVPHEHQVGQTGTTVQPKLYIAFGISGAVQHISGMQQAEIIVVINKDPDARMFNYADLGMVSDFQTVIPQMIEAVKRRKKS
ncbi:MAG: hypothetical protein A3G33_04320 [Omnitrophica bacterium RIFCSPLOWO2_12_FULL_44_17]|uniref:Electron transfer flavoprotein alpha/beta-subunit N-terminal domain-containing protein n=1 Tax=Candidatus Danuiimicrobium aquiferis TaxID=1801832 RepID=A0A1G1KQE5_9BACT|nr:MAG: hypothetical protein A3B72_10530 [Omnitrophica bacterium RIFCSPHIGHO2_02_FULL_45_28]OGW95160.1 MAG: hypothetical protein A3G33_04320 [Omnitrophica bacterium RIFCSPLOWO2_12_FULL_44_17]OGX01695.1 MAG: hypothetical protein A3J12_04115 [Omnitrophica bacterium RIFCSPLOWO2_02_FULL_44_11]